MSLIILLINPTKDIMGNGLSVDRRTKVAEKKLELKRIKPLFRLYKLLLDDKKDIITLLVYTIIISVIFLAIPLAAQGLINIISAGVLIQALLTLMLFVFLGLISLAILRLLQQILVEIIQQRIFAKVSIHLSEHIPRAAPISLKDQYAPELINRFFDVLTVQKTLSKLLLDIPSAILQILIGLILMGFYSSYLLAFDIFFIASIALVFYMGKNAFITSKNESTEKYKVAHWLEEIGRCQISIKMNGAKKFSFNKIDKKVKEYLNARRAHFRILMRQFFSSFLLQGFALTGVLGIGAWLVINQSLTLGQLFAAEIIIVMILSALDKITHQLEAYYDLLAGLDKLGIILDLEEETFTGRALANADSPTEVVFENLFFSYFEGQKLFENLSLHVKPGSRVSLVGVSGAGKTTLAELICGLRMPDKGNLFINGQDIRTIKLKSLRSAIALVSDSNEIFSGTVEENILMGRDEVSEEELTKALDIAQLRKDLSLYPDGLKTMLISEGNNISLGQRQRILIARAIIKKPQILILDEAFSGMDEKTKMDTINELFKQENPWTIINITHDAELVSKTEIVHILEGGKIIESGLTKDLAMLETSHFTKLFPELASLIKREARNAK